MRWTEYGAAMLLFSLVSFVLLYAILRLQAWQPWGNPQALGSVPPYLAFNTAVSFTTNTNWQAYGGESTVSYLTQMAASRTTTSSRRPPHRPGCGVRPGHRPPGERVTGQLLGGSHAGVVVGTPPPLPGRCARAGVAGRGAELQAVRPGRAPGSPDRDDDGWDGPGDDDGNGRTADRAGPGGIAGDHQGARHERRRLLQREQRSPVREPDATDQPPGDDRHLAIPAGLVYMLGEMSGSRKHGWTVWAAMAFLFLAGVTAAYWAEARGNPLLAADQHASALAPGGNMEGKEVRFGIPASVLFATVTTGASCGAVNAMHDSFTPLGGMVPLVNIMLGEVIFGGVGAGLYGMLVFVILAVFIAGLMVGTDSRVLGKKIEAYDVQMSMLAVLIFPLTVLLFTAVFRRFAVVRHAEHLESGTARAHPDPLRVRLGRRQQRLRFRRLGREHALVQRGARARDARGPLPVHRGPCWPWRAIWPARSACRRHPGPSGDHAALCRAAGQRRADRRRADVLPALSLGPILEHLMMGQGRTF